MALQRDDEYVRFRCKACGKRLKVKKTFDGGQLVPCPRCGELVTIPLANIKAISDYEPDFSQTEEQSTDPLDPDSLIAYMKEEGEKKKEEREDRAEGPRKKWTPQKPAGRIQELNIVLNGLERVEQETVEKLEALFSQSGIPKEEIGRRIETICGERESDMRKLCTERLRGLETMRLKLVAKRGVLPPAGLQRLEEIERTLDALHRYFSQILKLRLS